MMQEPPARAAEEPAASAVVAEAVRTGMEAPPIPSAGTAALAAVAAGHWTATEAMVDLAEAVAAP